MKKTILMLEHDDDDRYITQEVFKENNYDVKLEFFSNSFDLLNHLHTTKPGGQGFPSLILMSFVTFPMSAIDLLKEVKSNPEFAHIPMVVLGGHLSDEVITRCYAAGASTVIQKPDSVAGTNRKIDSFIRYWFETATLA